MLTVCIDWLAGTFKGDNPHEAQFINKYARSPIPQAMSPRFGYTSAEMDGNGVQLLWNVDRPEMGTHVVYPGSALRKLQECDGIQLATLLRDAANAELAITRLDLAKDFMGQPIDLEAVYQSLERGRNEGAARTYRKMQSQGGGFTVYVGAPSSDKKIRIYNKAAEQEIANHDWTRYELEAHGMVARAIAQSLVSSGDWAGVFDTASLAMLDLGPKGPLAAFYAKKGAEIGLPKIERTSDREKWISEQVISAVAKHYIDNPDSEAVKRLVDTLLLIAQQRKVDTAVD